MKKALAVCKRCSRFKAHIINQKYPGICHYYSYKCWLYSRSHVLAYPVHLLSLYRLTLVFMRSLAALTTSAFVNVLHASHPSIPSSMSYGMSHGLVAVSLAVTLSGADNLLWKKKQMRTYKQSDKKWQKRQNIVVISFSRNL